MQGMKNILPKESQELIHEIICVDRKEAYNLEMKIKSRGIRRYLDENNIVHGK